MNSAPLFFPDVEAFAKAMETETKSDQDGDSKDKKDDDEDMSLDWALFKEILLFNVFILLLSCRFIPATPQG